MTAAQRLDPSRPWVAISTAGPIESVALGLRADALACRRAPVVRGAPRTLTRALAGLLDDAGIGWADVGAWACDVGPGSFTGVRLGASIAQTFAWAHAAPMIAVGTFEAIAERVAVDGALLITLPARRGVHYAGLRDAQGGWHEAEVADAALRGWVAERLGSTPVTVCGAFRAPPRPGPDAPHSWSEALDGLPWSPGAEAACADATDVWRRAHAKWRVHGDAAAAPRLVPRYLGVPAAARAVRVAGAQPPRRKSPPRSPPG